MLRDIAILAACYFIAGDIGISLAVPPGFATIIWPASGVALCAVMARGGAIWPGIWLGSFSLNVMNGYDSSANFSETRTVVLIAAAIGIGAVLQALAGLWMARRVVSEVELSDFRRMALAILLVVALPCTIGATIGTSTLFAAGAVSGDLLLTNWLTWFSGDFLGVVFVLPILLLSNRSPVPVRWRGRSLQGASSLVAISLVSTLLLTFYAWQFVSEREYHEAEESFAAMAADTEEALRHRLEFYQRALEGGAAFVAVEEGVSPSRWSEYVDRLEISRTYPGMHGFGMFEAVSAEDLPAFKADFTREFGDRFRVHPRVERDEHFVINRIEPLESNLAALGLDLAFEEGRREAIALSKTRDDPILTRPIVLVQDQKQGAGFLLMLPVLDETGEPSGKWVYAPLIAEELLTNLTPRQGEEFDLQFFYGDEAGPDNLLVATGSSHDSPRFALERTVQLAGQPFSLRWTSLLAFERGSQSSAPTLILTSGLLITVLLGLLLTTFLRREGHVVRKVEEATAELAERNKMLEMAEATAHIGHWRLDLDGDKVNWSDEVFRLHGLPPGDTPELEAAIDFFHPEDRTIVENSIEKAIATAEPYRFKARLISADQEMRHVEVRGRAETGSDGEATAILGVIIDRTDETLMRQRLTETLEEARAADNAKSNFLANMSHEIRTPMNGVVGFTELALSEEKDPEQKRRLQMIADSGNAMLQLLNDLLDFAKIEAKQMTIISEPTDLRQKLQSCLRLMEPVARARNLPLRLEIDPALPDTVLVDKMRIRQIVLNLLGNAVKFTEEGEISIDVSVSRRRSDQNDRIFITVRDTGIGIPADRLERIFEKFTQADDTTARRFGGTGLGLPISAELARLMDGSLSAESELGKGSSFTLSLPLREAVAEPSKPAFVERPGACRSDTALRILVAEDNPINQELTLAMVKQAGHQVELAQNGSEAVEAVRQASSAGQPFDLVLMDMQMPEMDGLQACRAIREAGYEAAELPIVAVTANAYSDDVDRCKEAGMQAHLAKPLRLNDLCSAIEEWSGRQQVSGEAAAADAIEQETDARLVGMFEERKANTVKAIDAYLGGERSGEEDKQGIANLLHQIAGVAAFFGQADLGETCRLHEHRILDASDERGVRAAMDAIRSQIAETVNSESAVV